VEWVSEGSGVRLLGFVALVSICVYFCYYSGGCLCQGLQGARDLYI
jgi:hypothetical protein